MSIPIKTQAFDMEDLRGLARKFFSQRDIELIQERGEWGQTEQFSEYVVKAHLDAMGMMRMSTFDKNILKAMIDDHDDAIPEFVRSLKIGNVRALDLYGDNKLRHPANAVAKCAKLELFFMIALKIIAIQWEKLNRKPQHILREEYLGKTQPVE